MKLTAWLTASLVLLCLGCGEIDRDPESVARANSDLKNGNRELAGNEADIDALMSQFENGPQTTSALGNAAERAPDYDPRFQDAADSQLGSPDSTNIASNTPEPSGTQSSVGLTSDEAAPTDDPRVLAANSSSSEGATVQKQPVEIPKARRGRDGRFDITFDHIKFEMEKEDPFDRSLLTSQVESLEGEPIRIRGYILNTPYQEFSQFVLVRDNLECCFGPGAALYDCIVVKMTPGKTANYTVRPVTVEGVFRVSEMKDPFDDSKIVAIYEMLGESVR